MKKIFWISCLLFLGLVSCKKEEVPENLLPQERMTDLLYNLTLLNSRQSSYVNADTLVIDHNAAELLSKYGLDSVSFVKQHRYYMDRPEVYTQMFDSVEARLQREIKKTEAMPEDPRDKKKEEENKIRVKVENIKSAPIEVIKEKQQ